MTRTVRQLAFALVFDTVLVALTGYWALRAATARSYTGTAIDGALFLFWLRVTWKDLDRWTGPERR
jgi:hypothetical protein